MSYKEDMHAAAVAILKQVVNEGKTSSLRFPSVQQVLVIEYTAMLDEKELVAIEMLPEDEKRALVRQARELVPLATNLELLRLCRVLHLVNELNKSNNHAT